MSELDHLVGLTLNGAYRLTRRIASGGVGVIFEGAHLRLPGKRYAIKVLRSAQSPSTLQRFQREAVITSELGHDHIIEIHDFNVTEEGMPYLVMEYLEGEDLSRRIGREAPMSLAQTAHITRQVAQGLDAAHREGVVHRDLKPPNIYLSRRMGRDDYVKILDFGVSKVRDYPQVITGDNTVTGTPNYMSPEQAEGRRAEVDHRTDIFALGVVVWEMLTGRRVFDSPSVSGTIYQVVHLDPMPVHAIRPDIPPRVDDILARAMAKNHRARYASVMMFADELSEIAATHPCADRVASVVRAELAPGTATIDITPGTTPTGQSVWTRTPPPPAIVEQKKRVVFVDDSPTMRTMVASWLEQAGHDVALADDGEDGAAKVAADPPDLVIADVNMPRRDGFALCRTIKGSAATAHIPVILFTRLDEATDIVNGLAAGADAFVVKGSGATDLIRQVEDLIAAPDPRRRKTAAVASMRDRLRPTLGRKAIFRQLFAALFREVPVDVLTLLVDHPGHGGVLLVGSHSPLDRKVADDITRTMADHHAALSGRPLAVDQLETELIVIDEASAWGAPIAELRRSVMVPMLDDGAVIGCLGVFSFDDNPGLDANIRFFFDIGVAAARALRATMD